MTEDEAVMLHDVRDTIMNFRQKSRSVMLIGALTLVAALSGCSSEDASPTDAEISASAPADSAFVAPREVPVGMGSGKSDGEFPRTVSHFKGDTTIESQPEKVVVISTGKQMHSCRSVSCPQVRRVVTVRTWCLRTCCLRTPNSVLS